MDPKTFLVWNCAIIFAATGVITILGLIKVIKIDKGFLNKLFFALILEIVAISVAVFSDFFTTSGKTPTGKVWLVTAKMRYLDEDGHQLSAKDYVNDITVKQSSPTLFQEKNVKRVRFYAWGTDKSGRDINLTFGDFEERFNDFPFNLKIDDIDSISEDAGEIYIGTIDLQLTLDSASYNPPKDTIKPTTDGPKIN